MLGSTPRNHNAEDIVILILMVAVKTHSQTLTMINTDQESQPIPKSTESFEALLALFKASSDKVRIKILHLLDKDSYGVLELCSLFDCKQPTISHHLKTLSNAGLVTSRREGSSIYYSRNQRPDTDQFEQLQQAIFASIDQLPVPSHIQARIELIQQNRADSSRRFFKENFDKLNQQQTHLASYELYGESTLALIKKHCHKFSSTATIVEIGPGEGEFLAELAPLFKQVVALENSKPMRETTQQRLAEKKFSNIQFLAGNTNSKALPKLNAQVAVTNMVLHHRKNPADTFKDVAKWLATGGHFFISELCHHNQEWVKDSCGDLWLGFDPDEMSGWAEKAGFSIGESIYFTQRNGFRIQIRQFIKQD